MGTDIANGWNYLFTTILLNVWHLWIDLDKQRHMAVTFKDFCESLAVGIVTHPSLYPLDEDADMVG